MGDLKTRHMMESKDGMSLSLLTPEDMERLAFVEVQVPCGEEDRAAPWLPVTRKSGTLATFYDTRMGNFDARTFPTQPCSTCSNTMTGKFGNERCQGHFGYVSMPRRYPGDPTRRADRLFVVNPHLAGEAELLLQAECFFCHKFRVPEFDVERYRQALALVDAGLTGEALHFLDVVANTRGQDNRNRRRREPNEEVINDVRSLREHVERILRQHNVVSAPSTSSQADGVADGVHDKTLKSVLDIRNELCKQALREFREFMPDCSHCQCISPRITSKNGHLFFFFNKKNAEFNVAQGVLTKAQLQEWHELNQRHQRKHTYYDSGMAREHIKQLCQREGAILQSLYPHMGESTIDMPYDCPLPPNLMYKVFFLDKVLVPPLPLRLASGVQVSERGVLSPDDQTRALSNVLGFAAQIEAYFILKNNSTAERNLVSERQEVAHEQNLRNLQSKVTEFYTNMMDTFAKKEGLFRMHMMGKRVNQACRSVISPDYLVEPNEVLLPRPFARGLTFPEQVTNYAPARAMLLKQCVINGPSIYPGASHLEIRYASGEVRFVDLNTTAQARRQQAQRYFAMTSQTGGTLIVHRHILDGDRLIFNRQPTLHKASMMGYRAKVLSGLKTLRFHYVNGKSYNADFDGDEMNVHIPQSIEAKAELDCIMDANMNYLVPTSGKPIRGLIQDHIVAGVLLTLRDKFLDHGTFVQLVFNGVSPYMRAHGRPFANNVSLTDIIPVPAVLKPRPLWTGKQLISVLVRYVTGAVEAAGARPAVAGSTRATDGVTLSGTSLVQPSAYTTTDPTTGKLTRVPSGGMDDDRVLFLKSELVTGVLCKNQLGPANLSVAHVIHEIYGPHMVGELFGAFGRVLTMSLQREGFSMGMDDMCLVQEGRRAQLLRELDEAPLALAEDEAVVMPVIMGMATQLQKEFVPGRMLVPFPRNQLLLMTMSGAKGSNTNTIQMSLGLGQQLFDGRRVGRMNSGKTLPAFFIGEKRARSFGYAMGRFASGIRPPEYTIHAMAGRDGLIDTAVKTSRSGHLQRCLIKGLESLVVHWDHSVRDANGSVIQFIYGGDGLDPMKASSLQAWDVAKDNVYALCRKYGVDSGVEIGEEEPAATAASSARPSAVLDETAAAGGHTPSARPSVAGGKRGRPDEALAAYRAAKEAAVSQQLAADPLPENMQRGLNTYLRGGKADYVLFQKVSQVSRWSQQHKLTQKLREKREENVTYLSGVLGDVTARKRLRAYCDAGEPVGLLAAQAAGEPSTQMTLNTFHSAGSTVTHVTEGIPRLRELLIHASVKKAAIVVPVEKATEADEEALTKILNAGVATKLTDCLGCSAAAATPGQGSAHATPYKGYHFHVERAPEQTHLLVSLLFSKHLLAVSREKMCMSADEHLHSFKAALLGLAKQVISVLRGRGEMSGGTADVLQQGVQDPAQMGLGGAADGADSADDEHAPSDDDDDENERSTVDGDARSSQPPGTPGMGPQKHGRRGGRAGAAAAAAQASLAANEEEEDSGDDDEDGAGRGAKKAANDEEDDSGDDDGEREAEMLASATKQSSGQQSYDSFEAVCGSYAKNKFQLEIAPLSADAAAKAGVVACDGDLFVVNVLISMPPHVVAVIPDVVDRALVQQTLPSWLPQFEHVSFTRKADDVTSGDLVFQGSSATIRHVSAFLSLFTLRAKAIKLRKARSTDIQDMRYALGVESAYKSLFDELDKLFRRYAVDYHHLTLIADAATHRGRWENFNFTGVISHSASPLFQMTFASSKRFLHTSLTRGIGDDLNSISSAIMVGERPRVGTAFAKVSQDPGILTDVIERMFA